MSVAALAAAHNLRVDNVTADVLRAFGDESAAAILLKGPSTVRWLYAGEARRYYDCDLLVAPDSIERAERALRRLGFAPVLDREEMPAWWREHAVEWLHPQERPPVDLHRSLVGVGVDDARLWEVLSTATEQMIVGGFGASVLSLPARALHIALHAAQHAGDKGDLLTALAHVDEATWRDAARLAGVLEATAAFAAGLRQVPQGEALVATLGLPRGRPVDVALRAERAPAEALTFDRLARAGGTRERIAIVRQKLFPPPTFMRHWSKRARRGRVGLLIAYGERLVWVAGSAPRAMRAWRRARRGAQAEPPST